MRFSFRLPGGSLFETLRKADPIQQIINPDDDDDRRSSAPSSATGAPQAPAQVSAVQVAPQIVQVPTLLTSGATGHPRGLNVRPRRPLGLRRGPKGGPRGIAGTPSEFG